MVKIHTRAHGTMPAKGIIRVIDRRAKKQKVYDITGDHLNPNKELTAFEINEFMDVIAGEAKA